LRLQPQPFCLALLAAKNPSSNNPNTHRNNSTRSRGTKTHTSSNTRQLNSHQLSNLSTGSPVQAMQTCSVCSAGASAENAAGVHHRNTANLAILARWASALLAANRTTTPPHIITSSILNNHPIHQSIQQRQPSTLHQAAALATAPTCT